MISKVASVCALLFMLAVVSLDSRDNVRAYSEPSIKVSFTEREENCLKELLWYEARGLSTREKEAVLDVVVNRYNSSIYPNTFCKVVKQDWQFSYRNGISDSQNILPKIQNISGISDKLAMIEISQIVEDRLEAGRIKPNKVLKSNVMHYHVKGRIVDWSDNGVRVRLDKDFKHVYYAGVK